MRRYETLLKELDKRGLDEDAIGGRCDVCNPDLPF